MRKHWTLNDLVDAHEMLDLRLAANKWMEEKSKLKGGNGTDR